MTEFRVGIDDGEAQAAPAAGAAPLIEFLCAPALFGRIPPPERAVRFVPEWFKRLPREMGMKYPDGRDALTAKGCLPMTDAFALGFVIPLPFDARLVVPEDRLHIQLAVAPGLPFQPVESHHPAQIGAPAAPFERTMPLKFTNPWRIRVPPGYSVLFTHPLSRPDLPFIGFSGLVDCDRFDTTVNLPFAWTGPPGDHLLPAGTPIAQLIPLRRDTLIKDETARPSSDAELAEQAEAKRRKHSEESPYARNWRVKK